MKIGNDHLHAMSSVPKACFVSCLFGKTDCHALLIFASVNILRSKKNMFLIKKKSGLLEHWKKWKTSFSTAHQKKNQKKERANKNPADALVSIKDGEPPVIPK